MLFPETFILSIFDFSDRIQQQALRLASKRFNNIYQQYWLIQAKLNFGRIRDRHDQLIDSFPRFRLSIYQGFPSIHNQPLPPFTVTGFRSGDCVRPFISECTRRAGLIADRETIDQLINEGADPLYAIFGLSTGLARHPGSKPHEILLAELRGRYPSHKTNCWMADGFIAGGSLEDALMLNIQPPIDWLPIAIQHDQLQLIDPLVKLIGEHGAWWISVHGVNLLAGRILMRYGHPIMARKYGHIQTTLEQSILYRDTSVFRKTLETLFMVSLDEVSHGLVCGEAMELVPVLYQVAKTRGITKTRIDRILMIHIMSTRKFHLLSSLTLDRSIRKSGMYGHFHDILVKTFDRDIIAWFLDPDGYDNPEEYANTKQLTLKKLNDLGRRELVTYFSR